MLPSQCESKNCDIFHGFFLPIFQDTIEDFGPRKVDISNPILRQNCSLTESEFIEKFVRSKTPVILQNCQGYEWLQKYEITVEKLAKVHHNN